MTALGNPGKLPMLAKARRVLSVVPGSTWT